MKLDHGGSDGTEIQRSVPFGSAIIALAANAVLQLGPLKRGKCLPLFVGESACASRLRVTLSALPMAWWSCLLLYVFRGDGDCPCALVRTRVPSCAFLRIHVHSCALVCIRMHSRAFACIRVHSRALACTRAHSCALVCILAHSCAFLRIRVHSCAFACIPYAFPCTRVHSCALVCPPVHPCAFVCILAH